MWHHLCLTSGQSEVLFTGAEENLNMPSTAITQYDFSIGKGQIIGEEILGSARLLMFVVLDRFRYGFAYSTQVARVPAPKPGYFTSNCFTYAFSLQ